MTSLRAGVFHRIVTTVLTVLLLNWFRFPPFSTNETYHPNKSVLSQSLMMNCYERITKYYLGSKKNNISLMLLSVFESRKKVA